MILKVCHQTPSNMQLDSKYIFSSLQVLSIIKWRGPKSNELSSKFWKQVVYEMPAKRRETLSRRQVYRFPYILLPFKIMYTLALLFLTAPQTFILFTKSTRSNLTFLLNPCTLMPPPSTHVTYCIAHNMATKGSYACRHCSKIHYRISHMCNDTISMA